MANRASAMYTVTVYGIQEDLVLLAVFGLADESSGVAFWETLPPSYGGSRSHVFSVITALSIGAQYVTYSYSINIFYT